MLDRYVDGEIPVLLLREHIAGAPLRECLCLISGYRNPCVRGEIGPEVPVLEAPGLREVLPELAAHVLPDEALSLILSELIVDVAETGLAPVAAVAVVVEEVPDADSDCRDLLLRDKIVEKGGNAGS